MSKKVKVRCTVVIDVEFPDDFDDDLIKFVVEENTCPGTGAVGAALETLIRESEATGICWACNSQGKNELA